MPVVQANGSKLINAPFLQNATRCQQHAHEGPTRTEKKDDISAEAWQLVEEKQKAIEANDDAKSQTLTQSIKPLARSDRERTMLSHLEDIDAHGYKWEGLKRARISFQPKRTKFRNQQGVLIKESDFATEAAKYLSEVQWARPTDDTLTLAYENKPLYTRHEAMNDNNFAIDELHKVIDAQKNSKTPGPDSCTAELTNWLDDNNRLTRLEIFNNILDTNTYPDSLTLANIVPIYKKGDATYMRNCRPIALLQTFHKLFAGFMKSRLLHTYDSWVQACQFGFRPRKSTAQAIFIARRLMDIAESAGTNLTLVLLDGKRPLIKLIIPSSYKYSADYGSPQECFKQFHIFILTLSFESLLGPRILLSWHRTQV